MIKKDIFGRCKIPMNLQLFADGDDTGANESEGGGAAEVVEDVEPKSFDEILKEGAYQAEFDRRVQKALETQKSKLEVLMDAKASEAEKLAKMNKEEKAQYLHQKREKELADKEAAITRRELTAEAKVSLADKGLPVELAEVLNYTDADACKASIEAVEAAFQKAVEKSVEDRLKGGKPPKKAPETEAVTKESFSKMGYTERLKLKSENPELYKQMSGN